MYGVRSSIYITQYLTYLIVDSVLAFCVLIELSWSVLRPIHSSLSRRVLWVIGGLILMAGAAIWPFASLSVSHSIPRELSSIWHLQQTISVLRVVVFLLLAGASQLLSIGWRDRELQVATGFGFYSFIGIVIAVLHTHRTARGDYGLLDRFVVASYLCSLLYWIFSFAQKEQERRKMSPQAQDLLLSLAGAARATRTAFAASRQQHSENK
jgi:hypothetical protein